MSFDDVGEYVSGEEFAVVFAGLEVGEAAGFADRGEGFAVVFAGLDVGEAAGFADRGEGFAIVDAGGLDVGEAAGFAAGDRGERFAEYAAGDPEEGLFVDAGGFEVDKSAGYAAGDPGEELDVAADVGGLGGHDHGEGFSEYRTAGRHHHTTERLHRLLYR